MVKIIDKNKSRIRRHKRVRSKITGTAECPRLNVFRSSQHIYAQVIDDVKGVTLAAASSTEKGFEGFGGVAQRSDHLHIALRIYGARERIAQHSLVLDNHEPDHDNSFS